LDVSGQKLSFDDGSFDLFTCFGMMDYLSFFDPLVRGMFRVLQRGGYALVSLPG
jgi:ubiquinone/menaquinone biosynthesis C-methylase UbiE